MPELELPNELGKTLLKNFHIPSCRWDQTESTFVSNALRIKQSPQVSGTGSSFSEDLIIRHNMSDYFGDCPGSHFPPFRVYDVANGAIILPYDSSPEATYCDVVHKVEFSANLQHRQLQVTNTASAVLQRYLQLTLNKIVAKHYHGGTGTLYVTTWREFGSAASHRIPPFECSTNAVIVHNFTRKHSGGESLNTVHVYVKGKLLAAENNLRFTCSTNIIRHVLRQMHNNTGIKFQTNYESKQIRQFECDDIVHTVSKTADEVLNYTSGAYGKFLDKMIRDTENNRIQASTPMLIELASYLKEKK